MLDVTPMARNLESSPTILGLEIEDFMILGVVSVVGYFIGQIGFSGTTILGLPANFFFLFLIAAVGFVGLSVLKYGKPRGHAFDLLDLYMKPKAYCAAEPDSVLTEEYIEHEEPKTDA